MATSAGLVGRPALVRRERVREWQSTLTTGFSLGQCRRESTRTDFTSALIPDVLALIAWKCRDLAMTRRYNAKHPERCKSHYKARLAKRNLTRPPALRTLNALRKKAGLPPHPAPVK